VLLVAAQEAWRKEGRQQLRSRLAHAAHMLSFVCVGVYWSLQLAQRLEAARPELRLGLLLLRPHHHI
jgi:hypothetical protein